jgi:glutamine amidotransferase
MSARRPTDVNRSLALLKPRGGEIGPHADGWGVAFYEGRAARVFKEPRPASNSRCLALIADHDYQSSVVIGHIRKANPPEFGRTAANTHPFSRELGGRSWVFAHNGKLPGVHADDRFSLGRFLPIGDTDSEHAFCFLLDRVALTGDARQLSADAFVSALREPLAALSTLGVLNVVLSDGVHLIAFANTSLYWLARSCRDDACRSDECEQRVALLATAPLTDEPWQPLVRGEVHVFAGGTPIQ